MESRANSKQINFLNEKEQEALKNFTNKNKLVIKPGLSKVEYQRLVAFLATLSPQFSLVTRDSLVKSKTAVFLERMNEHLISKRIVSEWPGTKLLYNTAQLHIFAVNSISINVIMNSAETLYDWLEPKLPEDLCFISHDGHHSLISISHKKNAWLQLDEHGYSEVLKLMPQIFVNIHKK